MNTARPLSAPPFSPIAVSGIHTEVGKTLCSAVLVQALGCDYWKPIQAGSLNHSDTMQVRAWVERDDVAFLPERHRLTLAASPHLAAQQQGVRIEIGDFVPSQSPRPLLIETAGGVCSPINHRHTVADLLAQYGWSTVLVVRHYLGSISHTVSAVDALRARGVGIVGLMINGERDAASEQFIDDYCQLPTLAHIPDLPECNRAAASRCAAALRADLPLALHDWLCHE